MFPVSYPVRATPASASRLLAAGEVPAVLPNTPRAEPCFFAIGAGALCRGSLAGFSPYSLTQCECQRRGSRASCAFILSVKELAGKDEVDARRRAVASLSDEGKSASSISCGSTGSLCADQCEMVAPRRIPGGGSEDHEGICRLTPFRLIPIMRPLHCTLISREGVRNVVHF